MMRRHRAVRRRHRASAVLSLGLLVALASASATVAQTTTSTPSPTPTAPPPPPSDQCDRITDCPAVTLPSALECDADACVCARRIDCYVRNAQPERHWSVVPGGELHWNAFFWHTRYLQTRISPAGAATFASDLDPANAMIPLPPGTVVYKQGYFPTSVDPALPDPDNYEIFVATKLDGDYCPEGARVGDACQGGGWFWYHTDSATPQVDHSRFQGGGSFSGYGKPSKCVGCHDTAQRGDFLMAIMIQRRYPPATPGGP